MKDLTTIRALFRYSDWANAELVKAAGPLTDAQLDRRFDMGRGSLRVTLLHILSGESVWLSRWQGNTETPWPNEEEKATPPQVGERLRKTWSQRDGFLASVEPPSLAKLITYRDSKGSLYRATLGDMMLQMIVHSAHHRAQAANMLRQAAGVALDLDYMYWIRQPEST